MSDDRRPPDQDGGRELHFHYDREERVSRRVVPPPNFTKGWLRGNRSVAILLIDAIIVVILFFIFIFFLQPMSQRHTIGPYEFSGRAVRFDNEILVSLRVEASSPDSDDWEAWESDSPESQGQAVMTTALQDQSVDDLVPLPGADRLVRYRIPDDGQENVTVRVQIRDQVIDIPIEVDDE